MNASNERPVAAMLAALAVGALGGGLLVGFVSKEIAPVEVIQVTVPPSQEELQIECLEFMQQTATTLQEAQTRVSALEIQVREKSAEVDRLEGEMERATVTRSAIGERLEEARVQLTTLEQQLQAAVHEKQVLQEDLDRTKETLLAFQLKLAMAEEQYIEAREDTLGLKWENFVQAAQATICEGGAVAVVATCREQVKARLSRHKKRYQDCVRSNQAEPEITHARPGEEIPEFATWIDENDRATRGWYVWFCDPKLPEAGPQAQRRDGEATWD